MIFIMMGVSGCGKTAVGQELAKQLFCHFHDGDDLHSTENKNKMAANIPLNDEVMSMLSHKFYQKHNSGWIRHGRVEILDRFPWLLSIHECIKRYKHAHQNAVVACSALKQRYRHILLHGKDDVHQQMTVTVVLGSGSQNADTSPKPEVTDASPNHDATESLADGTMFVYLKGNTELLASRLQGRQGHFFPPSLLESQFAALEEPTESEHSILINIEKSVGEIVHDIMEFCQTL